MVPAWSRNTVQCGAPYMHRIRHRCPGAAAPYALKPFSLTRYRRSTGYRPNPTSAPPADATKVPQIAKTVPLTKVRQADTESDIPQASYPVLVRGRLTSEE